MKALPDDLLERETVAILKQYRASAEEVRQILLTTFAKYPKLLTRIHAAHPEKDVTRWRDYKKAVKEARKQVYYGLRRYFQSDEDPQAQRLWFQQMHAEGFTLAQMRAPVHALMAQHVSTRERLPQMADFYAQVLGVVGTPWRIADIACGLHPLSWPYYAAPLPESYLAVERDPQAMRILHAFRRWWPQLTPMAHDLAELELHELGEPDLTLLLKVVPVIARQERELLDKLAHLPGRYLLVTASAIAMTRYEDIRQREERVLRDFIARTGREVRAELTLDNEFGYIMS